MNKTPTENKRDEVPKSNLEMDAYIVMLHLVSQGWTNFFRNEKIVILGAF